MNTSNLTKKLATLWEKAAHGKTTSSSFFQINNANVSPPISKQPLIIQNEDYFQVRLNQIHLENQREWFTKYDPLVLITTEFLYGGEFISVPYLVGPNLFENQKFKTPSGISIFDTRVAGLYPYKGDRINIRLILYKIQRENSVRKVMGLIENIAGIVDFSTAVTAYLKLADVLIDGMENLLGMGKVEPIFAFSKEFDPEAGDILQEGYYALLNTENKSVNKEKMQVIDNLLYSEAGNNYTSSDFVLFSIRKSSKRTDIEQLPFYKLWEQAMRAALIPDEGHWKLAKANMMSLYQEMILSQDLTTPQAIELKNNFVTTLKDRRKEAVELSLLGGAKEENIEGFLDLLELDES